MAYYIDRFNVIGSRYMDMLIGLLLLFIVGMMGQLNTLGKLDSNKRIDKERVDEDGGKGKGKK